MNRIIILLLLSIFTFGNSQNIIKIKAENKLNLERKNETISLEIGKLTKYNKNLNAENTAVFEGDKELISQTIDNDNDGKVDELIFQANFEKNETKIFNIKQVEKNKLNETLVDGRFVLPREDYAWENDRVAFRMYGPALAKDVNNGVDVWTKRVRYLIVEKWYKQSEGSAPGKDTYHQDKGEGADFFSVGRTLGCGGSSIIVDDSLYQPGVFDSYKTISTGPIRVCFELYYDSILIGEKLFKEVRKISLDAGSNLNKIEVKMIPSSKTNKSKMGYAAGLVKRANTKVTLDKDNNWMGLWGLTNDKEENGYLGTGVVFAKSQLKEYKELPNQYLMTGEVKTGQTYTYYSGFGWTRSGDFESENDWNDYLNAFAKKINSKIKIKIFN